MGFADDRNMILAAADDCDTVAGMFNGTGESLTNATAAVSFAAGDDAILGEQLGRLAQLRATASGAAAEAADIGRELRDYAGRLS